MIRHLLALTVLMFVGTTSTVLGATFIVRPDGTGDYPTIQAAVNAAQPGDLIELTNGTFTGVGNRDVNYRGKAITITSHGGDPFACIIDCQGAGHAFEFDSDEPAEAILQGITVVNGGGDPGGAVLSWGASPTILDCRFIGCTTSMIGGAVCFISDSQPTLERCTFIDNSANFGGAVICWVDPEPTIRDCTFIDNSSAFGGAVECADRAVVLIESCTFWKNSASERGGAVMCEEDAHVTLRNCTLYANDAFGSGAGLCCEVNGHAILEHTIIAFSGSGEAIDCTSSSSATLACCDLFGNAGGDWVGHVADQFGIDGNFAEDPLFCDGAGGDLTLHSDSPCAWGNNPVCGYVGAETVGCGETASLTGPGIELIRFRAFPNPFGETTTLCLDFPRDDWILAEILDLRGRRIRTLHEGPIVEGPVQLRWDGLDDAKRAVGAGVYFFQVSSAEGKATGTLSKVR